MDELEIKGKKYISSKRASQLTGYAKDYVGQLARAGKIAGTRMGRAWYVEEQALLSHKKADIDSQSIVSPIQRVQRLAPQSYRGTPLPDTWTPALYSRDELDLIPKPVKVFETDLPQEEVVLVQKPIAVEPPASNVLENEIRIKILHERMRPEAPKTAFRPAIVEKARTIRKKRSRGSRGLSWAALTAALGLFLFFSSGFFFYSNTHFMAGGSVYTASVLMGFENIHDVVPALQHFFQAIFIR